MAAADALFSLKQKGTTALLFISKMFAIYLTAPTVLHHVFRHSEWLWVYPTGILVPASVDKSSWKLKMN